MLKSLYVKNYALIEEASIEFANGLNILTGETGAGKSILIGALGLILGGRASTDAVRRGAERAIVEGLFTVDDNDRARNLLELNEYEIEGNEITVRREINAKGTSRSFINDSPASLTLVKELGDLMVDLHGQHEHQMLLRPETHISMLDNVGGLEMLVADFAAAFAELNETRARLRELRRREAQLREKQEFHSYQLREIDAVAPQPGEDEAILQELKIQENGERIFELTSALYSLLYEQENSVRDQLLRARNLFDQLQAIDPSVAEYRAECLSAISIVEEIAKYTQSYSASIDFAPERLEEMRERLQALSGLRKKFGGTLDTVLAHREQIAAELDLVQNFEEQTAALVAEADARARRAGELGAKLSAKRTDVARKVARSIENVLKGLGIENGRFHVQFERTPSAPEASGSVLANGAWCAASANGIDTAEFYISTNLGEEPKPLARVASGGEISRVMLALKTILAKNDRLPLLIFDEIDTGISGRIASKVGGAMRDLADFHQIIAITHLPQIAAMSMHHYVVEKSEQGSRTITMVRKLSAEEHTREVAKLMSGEVITESSLQMARELIES
ncbi:MAG: DNA repair protein RecN [Bacteroidetes bacterium]|nr:DNA repair protein RecN [Bacteroidota bacterium]